MEEHPNNIIKGAVAPQPEQLREAIRFSLLTLLGITAKIEELKPRTESKTKPQEISSYNLLDPEYSRPWWPTLAGLGILYLGYKVLRSTDENNQKTN